MPRPVKSRKVCHYPQTQAFHPIGENENKDPVVLWVEEYEAIRLIDMEGFSQEQCSAFMQIARTTVQRIYETGQIRQNHHPQPLLRYRHLSSDPPIH